MAGERRARRALACIRVSAPICAALACFAAAAAPASARTPIEKQLNLRPGLQLEAMRAAISAAPTFFMGFNSGCVMTTPMLADSDGSVMAGNFRDQNGSCYVWLNVEQSPMLTGQEICKLALHEMGHLTGLQHSQDPNDVMYAPFQSTPVPMPCVKPIKASASSARHHRKRSRRHG